MKIDHEAIARAKRHRIFKRFVLWSLLPLIVLYLIADGVGVIPHAVSVRLRNQQRVQRDLRTKGLELDPNTILGIAIGDTRFRLNYTNGHAIVTRPIFGVEEWIIPAHFEYQGTRFTVTALDPFAFLHATTAHTISVPSTIEYFNGAPDLANDCLRHLYYRREDGSQDYVAYPRPATTDSIE
jgi:hypothetical protein